MVKAPKFYRLNNFENILKEGEIYSKTKIWVGAKFLEFNRKIPYINALVKTDNKLIFGLVDEEEIKIGEKVKAKVGKLGKTEAGLHIYGTIWEKIKKFEKPKPVGRKEKRKPRTDNKYGIVGYGIYIPRYRFNVSNLGKIWGRKIKGIKSFPGKFDDQISYACNSALYAIKHAGIRGNEVGFIEVGSESKVYAVKPTASIVASLLQTENCLVCDNEFACKAGTHALINGFNFVNLNDSYALAIGSDSAQGRPGDELELTVGDGACSLIIGKNPIAIIEGYASYTTDIYDFWRNEGDKFPKHASRFSGEPAYYKHIIKAAKKLMEKLDLKQEDIDYVVFHQPNSKFPRVVGKKLGFSEEQIELGIVFDYIGNTYSACSLLGLAKILDCCKEWQRILVVSYGSGAGSDAISLITTPIINERRKKIERSVKSWLGEVDKENLIFEDYGMYLKNKEII